jgi:hypothetical protein
MNDIIEIVYNAEYGGFGISEAAIQRMIELGSEKAKECYTKPDRFSYGKDDDRTWFPDIPRHDKHLVQVVKELGDKASGKSASLAICKVYAEDIFRIEEFDGKERVPLSYDHIVYGRRKE